MQTLKEKQELILEIWRKIENLAQYGGMGIGLYFSKNELYEFFQKEISKINKQETKIDKDYQIKLKKEGNKTLTVSIVRKNGKNATKKDPVFIRTSNVKKDINKKNVGKNWMDEKHQEKVYKNASKLIK